MAEDSNNNEQGQAGNTTPASHLGKDKGIHLAEMYQDWFLDYASYVILERAVPDVLDGLKPVQRRILHSMKRLDDGRYNKVANIIGHTMQFHPHGDASIGDALVQLGQKNLLIDMQGNWGNIHTGDRAAAARYIEARLSKFALDVIFNPKTTNWKLSYDGRNKEPITLPIKFPLLLQQGVEGIAVGLASKIMPHNFNEILDATILYLKEKPFQLYPDFPTGGAVDVSRYNDGLRGGFIKVRAKIEKVDNKTLNICELPYGKTTSTLIDSILKAFEKGKIKIKKVDDNTADKVEIIVHLTPGTSSDKTIDALYAFTDCEVSISPNSCIISGKKPYFLTVSDILKQSVDNTKALLGKELEIRKQELQETWHFASLEKIFIQERIYKDQGFEESQNKEAALDHIDQRLLPFKKNMIREVTREDLARLLEIRMARILRYNADHADKLMKDMEAEIEEINNHLSHLIDYTIAWYKSLKKKYGKGQERKTEIRSFETIEAAKVVVANEKLYFNKEEGFMGTSLKKDEFICNCSDIDDVLVIYKDGKYQISKVTEKQFIGKNVLHINIFKKNDKRTIYNLIYRDGKAGNYYIKRCAITGVTRDKEYSLTQDSPGTRIVYFSENPNGEAEVVKVILKPKPRLRTNVFEADFAEVMIKGRAAKGNILSKNDVHKISLRQKGVSTLGGRKIWFDPDIERLNTDARGEFLGEFNGDDKILVVTKTGTYYTTSYDLSVHFTGDILRIEKFEEDKVWTAALFDANYQAYYLKRFLFEVSAKEQNFIGEHEQSQLIVLSAHERPVIELTFGGEYKDKEPLAIEAEEFIAVKGYKAKGKRLSTFTIKKIVELEPLSPEPKEAPKDAEETGFKQGTLFDQE